MQYIISEVLEQQVIFNSLTLHQQKYKQYNCIVKINMFVIDLYIACDLNHPFLILSIEMSRNKSALINIFKDYLSTKTQRSEKEINEQTDKIFLSHIEQAKIAKMKSDPSLKVIPNFFKNNQDSQNSIIAKIKKHARNQFLKNKYAGILEEKDLQKLYHVLKEHISPPYDNRERINYNQFKKVAQKLPLKFKQCFKACYFMHFNRDEYGRIDIQSFFNQIVRKNNLLYIRMIISVFDSNGDGYLTQQNMKQYISELIPTFAHLKKMDESFIDTYVATAVRKFFFFLDPKKTGRIYIKNLMSSPILSEFYEFQNNTKEQKDLGLKWFSIQNATFFSNVFCQLDTNKNGFLRKQDLSRYSKQLSSIVIDRIFEEYSSVNGLMDYRGFLEFVLAMSYKKTPEFIQYFWRILDVYHKGAIDSFIINTFFRSIIQKLKAMNIYDYKVEDIKDEIFDMVKPELPMAITFNDLMRCQKGDTIILIMIDAEAFLKFDQGENVMNLNADNDNQ